MQTSPSELKKRMWFTMETSEPSVFVNTNAEGVERVRTSAGKYAFITWITRVDTENSRYPCDTMRLQGRLDSLFYAVVLPKNSTLK